jgi:hypothetical protein
MIELVTERVKRFRFLEITDPSVEHQNALFEAIFEKIKELASEQRGHDTYGKEEPLPAGYPTVVVRGQSAPGDNTVDVGVIHKVLTPGV